MKKLFTVALLMVSLSGSVSTVKAEEMTPPAKTLASLAVGGISGYIFGEVCNKSSRAGIASGILTIAALVYLRQGREDAIAKAFGPEYVGVSALAAVGAAVATIK